MNRKNSRKVKHVAAFGLAAALTVGTVFCQVPVVYATEVETTEDAVSQVAREVRASSSSVLNESDIVYMVLTDRFYDGDPTK